MTSNQTTTRRSLPLLARTAAALSIAAVVVLSTPHAATARETRDRAPSTVTAYSEPQPALGGQCLAQYLADHAAHVLGPLGV